MRATGWLGSSRHPPENPPRNPARVKRWLATPPGVPVPRNGPPPRPSRATMSGKPAMSRELRVVYIMYTATRLAGRAVAVMGAPVRPPMPIRVTRVACSPSRSFADAFHPSCSRGRATTGAVQHLGARGGPVGHRSSGPPAASRASHAPRGHRSWRCPTLASHLAFGAGPRQTPSARMAHGYEPFAECPRQDSNLRHQD